MPLFEFCAHFTHFFWTRAPHEWLIL